jgi:putative FmdB family regulatory protein
VPTYEYECPSGHRYEKREGFDAPATQKCLKCRRVARRLINAPSVVFKGSGFYITDSRKPAVGEAVDSNGSGPSKSESTSDSKSESAPSSETTKKDAVAPPKADKTAATS